MNNQTVKYFPLFFLMHFLVFSYGQDPKTPNVVPVSPNTAALMKAVEFPVNTASGTAGINIPLTSLSSANINVPVSVSYNSSGIRVTEEASSVGLGWALNAGGRISRVIQGIADGATYLEETQYGAYFISLEDSVANTPASKYYMHNVNRGIFDSQYDLYNYNFNGHSGTFIVKKVSDNGNGTVETSELKAFSIPENDVKINITGVDNGGSFDGVQITSFAITTPDGLIYDFNDYEETHTGQQANKQHYISSWLLSKIDTPNGLSNSVIFNYGSDTQRESSHLLYHTYKSIFAAEISSECPSHVESSYRPYITIFQKRISSIISPNQKVDFSYIPGRTDFPGSERISRIDTYKKVNAIWIPDGKEINFDNDAYFGNNGALNERLKLNSISIGNVNEVDIPKYLMEYARLDLPAKNSYAQDHWGYYNGKSTNFTLVPATKINGLPKPGADRSPNVLYAKATILEKIYYPTGGYTQFSHGLNTISGQGENVLIDHSSSLSVVNVPGDTGDENPQTDIEIITISEGYPLIFDSIIIDASMTEFPSDQPGIIIENLSTNEVISYTSLGDITHTNVELDLAPGNYKITASIRFEGSSVNASYRWQEDTGNPLYTKNIPGLRIEKVTKSTNDNSEESPIVTQYIYENDAGYSSGILFESGNYNNTYERYSDEYHLGGPFDRDPIECEYIIRSSSYNPMTNSGAKNGYYQVTTLVGELGEYGKVKEEYFYPNTLHSNLITPELLEKTTYRWNESLAQFETLVVENREHITFATTDQNFLQVSIVATGSDLYSVAEPEINPQRFDVYQDEHFHLPGGKRAISKIETSQYDNAGNELITTQKYHYGDHHFYPIVETKTVSKGTNEVFETVLKKYPLDYVSTSSTDIEALQNSHVISPVIEQQLWKGEALDSTLVSGAVSTYNLLGQPAEIKQLRTNVPLTSLDNETQTAGLYDTKISDSHYQNEWTNTFDLKGNLQQSIKHTGEVTSYLWGYDNTAVTAVIQNANANEIAYTSFENTVDKGGWSYGGENYPATSSGTISGDKVYKFQAGPILKSHLSAGVYIISFFVDNPSNLVVKLNGVAQTLDTQEVSRGWSSITVQLSINSLSDTIEISGSSGGLDELRLYPGDVTMRTFAHNPIYGVTSETDENGVSKFYKYDHLGRLERIEDQDLNTIKVLKYNYRQN